MPETVKKSESNAASLGSIAEISAGDYLSWYCAEITRYRDTEWAVSGYAGAFSLALIYFATDTDRKSLVSGYAHLIVAAIVIFTSFFVWSEAHIHRALNTWRLRRDALVTGGKHLTVSGQLVARQRDGRIVMRDLIYFAAFEGFVCTMALVAVAVVDSNSVAVAGVVIVLALAWACGRGHFGGSEKQAAAGEVKKNASEPR
jgi:hypothetical protein